jgi:hypothetical protein
MPLNRTGNKCKKKKLNMRGSETGKEIYLTGRDVHNSQPTAAASLKQQQYQTSYFAISKTMSKRLNNNTILKRPNLRNVKHWVNRKLLIFSLANKIIT